MKTLEIIFSFKMSKEDIKNFILLDILKHKLMMHPDFQRLNLKIVRSYYCYFCSGVNISSLYLPHYCILVKYDGIVSSLNTKLNEIWRQVCKQTNSNIRTNVSISLLGL